MRRRQLANICWSLLQLLLEMTMELRHIRYFLAVAEERHFTKAAAKVGIGQPPLSQQIKDLEAEIGTPLFHRVPHGAELTAAGEAFLQGVKEMPTLAERAIKAARRAARGKTGSLRVGFTASAAFNAVVPSAIRAFRRAYADVELLLEEANTTRLVAGLQDGSLDVAFLRPGAAGSEAFQLRLLSEEPMMVALPVRHPVAAQQEVELATLKEVPFLLFPRAVGPTLYDSIISTCRAAGFEPIIGQFAPQIASVVNLVAAELGVSIVPASMSQLQVSGVTYRPIAGQAATARLALAYRRGETSAVVRNFIAQAAV
jgi:DNA-binding transcriptional LysR family regulator